jgi:predicted kinase
MERVLVLVSGAPGSGKSTLAAGLAPALHVHLLSKDLIKETLWDTFDPPAGDREWSRRLGAAAMEVLWTLAALSPYALLEANFRPHSEHERARLAALSARIVEVHCWCPPEVATLRFEPRAAEHDHHPAHVAATLDPALLDEFDQPLGLGPVIRIDTTLPVDIEALARKVTASLTNT